MHPGNPRNPLRNSIEKHAKRQRNDCTFLSTKNIFMRPLTEHETTVCFEKLAKFMGKNISKLLSKDGENGCNLFRFHHNKVYYMNEQMLKYAMRIKGERLRSCGVCIGKFTKSGKFHLTISCLDLLAQYAEYKVWLKPSVEMSYLYGHNILKSGIAKVTENSPKYAGVVLLNSQNIPLGFGVLGHSAEHLKNVKPTDCAVFHQADTGEYLRNEDSSSLFT